MSLDPTDLIGSLYKLPLFIVVLWVSFFMVFEMWGYPGIVFAVLMAVLLARYMIKKDKEHGLYG